ncbi:MAG: hypothetical protein RLZZ127_3057 [Planctomycetota bacterium]|jgi:hypothetical protein
MSCDDRPCRSWWRLLLVATAALALVPMVWANLDLVGGRHMLFMDEQVVLDQVRPVLEPGSGGFLRALVLGTDHRYGQVSTVIAAAGAAVPWWIAGEPGLIAGVRITGAVCLVLGYLLMALAVLRLRPAAGLLAWTALAAVLVLPCTVYYGAMPKPEPVQILALGGFAWAAARRGGAAGWPCLFLGAAFAAKISALPMLAGAMAAIWWTAVPGDRWRGCLRSAAWMVVGAVVCEPAIALATGAWLKDTVLNTGHGADRPEIGPMAWLAHIHHGPHPFSSPWWAKFCAPTGDVRGPLPLSGWWLWIQVLAAAALLAPAVARFSRPGVQPAAAAIGSALLVAGLFSLAAIMVGVHRLWDFYLHPGLVLAAFGAALLVPRPAWARCRWSLGAAAAALAAPWIVSGALHATAAVRHLGTRTSEPGHAIQAARYDLVRSLAASAADALGRAPVVVLDPHLWDPGTTAGFVRIHAWGPRRPWEYEGDLLVIGPEQDPDQLGDAAGSAALAAMVRAGRPWVQAVLPPDQAHGLRLLVRRGSALAP